MKKFFITFFLIVFSFAIGLNVWAHEPRFIKDDQLVVIKNSEVSQAFYGELNGRAAYYLIDLKEERDLYFQILVPDLPGIQKDKTVTIDHAPELDQLPVNFAKIDPNSIVWKSFYEEYAGDNYFEGPSVKKIAEPGYYNIKITSPDNTGKYVLVVGDKEEFPALEMAKALITIPQLKTGFFNKPLWRSFEGKIGKYFGIGLLIAIVFIFMFHKFRQVYK
ncbi:MAG: hypothetical protein Q7K35_05615 [bacterium]|nr:hypothetical protein [bacterium]